MPVLLSLSGAPQSGQLHFHGLTDWSQTGSVNLFLSSARTGSTKRFLGTYSVVLRRRTFPSGTPGHGGIVFSKRRSGSYSTHPLQ